MKRFLPLGVIIVALLIILFAVRRCTQGSASGYQTATVTRGPITQLVTATGTLNPVVNVQVGSQVSGNIQKLFADFNSEVKAGQTVAQIDPAVRNFQDPQSHGNVGRRSVDGDVYAFAQLLSIDNGQPRMPKRNRGDVNRVGANLDDDWLRRRNDVGGNGQQLAFFLRVAAGWRGRRAAYGTIAGFGFTVIVLLLYLVRAPAGAAVALRLVGGSPS